MPTVDPVVLGRELIALSVIGPNQQIVNLPNASVKGREARFPPDPRTLELLMRITGVTINDRVLSWYSAWLTREQELSSLARRDDAIVESPRATGLWPFQRVGVDTLKQRRRSLLCDDMGLGKTAQAIFAVETSKRKKRVLLICPKSLKRWWEYEIRNWLGDSVKIVQCEFFPQPGYTTGWLIVHWEQIRMYPDFARWPWDWVVADEAHRIKNRKTQTFRAFKKVRAPFAILITGTPFSNNPSELWTLLSYINPSRWRSFWAFFEMFVEYAENYFGRKPVGVRNPDLLARELAPVMLRRSKEQVGIQLPPKVYKFLVVGMHPEQKEAYQQMSELYWTELSTGVEWTAPNAIARLVRLQQILCSLELLQGRDCSAKLDALMDMILDSDNEPIVVFSKFRRTVELVQRRCEAVGVECEKLLGGMGDGGVGEVVERFQRGKFRILAGTLATGGVGLTLTRARTVVFVDKHWNPAVQRQAEDRLHRIGQAGSVQVVYLHTQHTVDDTVERVCRMKEAITGQVLAEQMKVELEYWRNRSAE